MITKIRIDGFKSFQNFEMDFTPLTVIAGANGSGKSNLFDALRLLSRLSETDLKTAFSEQRGDSEELFTQFGDDEFAEEMGFEVEMLVARTIVDNWGGKETLNHTRLRYELKIVKTKSELGLRGLAIKHESLEKIKPEDDQWAKKIVPKKSRDLWKSQRAGGTHVAFIRTEQEGSGIAIKLRQDGKHGGRATLANAASQTVLGGINSVDFPHAFAAKEEMRSWKFMQLNPEDLRAPSRQEVGLRDVLTESGRNLAAVLFRISQTDPYALKEISRMLNSFLPNFIEVLAVDDKVNRQYLIKLRSEEGEFSSRVLSEGTLRLLALCILNSDEQHTGLLCFEEPENGIHPFRIAAMATLLKELSTDFEDARLRQVVVNTHSPGLVMNMLKWGDEVNVGVWLSDQHNLIKVINDAGEKRKIRITRTNRVVMSNAQRIFEPNNLEQLTLAEVAKYLGSKDIEEVKRELVQ